MKVIHKYWKGIVSAIFGLVVFLFWLFPYSGMLNFQEQFQLFLFDTDYLVNRIMLPGGLTDYIAEFLTQFYYVPFWGAFILAMIYVVSQRLLWLISRNDGATDAVYLLTFVPSLILWFVMGDVNVMLCYAISLLLILLTILYYARSKEAIRIIYGIVSIPIMYWLIGSTVYVFIVYAIIKEFKTAKSRWNILCLSLFYVVYIIAIILLSSLGMQYPISRLYYGLFYYRFPVLMPYIVFAVMGVYAIAPSLLTWLSPHMKSSDKKRIMLVVSQVLALVIGGYFLLDFKYNTLDYEVINYDSMVRHQQWDKIISEAEKKNPTTPQSVCCLNLALAQTGQLGDRAFSFFQNGSEGLIPMFERDFTSPLPASEVYFYLGMIDAAQQNVFEAQEAIPNYNKSGRCTKRLAETNLINGQYAVASKYLRMLQKTLFYKRWATDQLARIANKAIDSDFLYGTLRQFSYNKDFLFSIREKDKMIGKLFTINPNNRMALDYLLTYELLDCKMNNFLMYFKLMKMANYDHFPMCYQQAMAYVWSQSHPDFSGIPSSYDQSMLRRFMEFYQIYSTEGAKSSRLDSYKDTYWHYFLIQK